MTVKPMDVVLFIIGIAAIIMLGVLIFLLKTGRSGHNDAKAVRMTAKNMEKLLMEMEVLKSRLDTIRSETGESGSRQRQELASSINAYSKSVSDRIDSSQYRLSKTLNDSVSRQLSDMSEAMEKQLKGMSRNTAQQLSDMNRNLQQQMTGMSDNSKQQLSDMNRNLQQQMTGMSDNSKQQLSDMNRNLQQQMTGMSDNSKQQLSDMNRNINQQLASMNTTTKQQLSDMSENISDRMKQMETRFSSLEVSTENKLKNIRDTVDTQLREIRSDNTVQLEKIRGTVDEKLQETLTDKMNESFRLVSERLEQVYKSLGEMQTVAQGVGDLKKVLSNVKTRGILGEIQLGAILRDILAPEQYEENVATVPNSSNRVEFAVRLPGAEDGKVVYLPIDSKFNGDKFSQLQSAYDTGSKELIAAAKKELYAAVKKCAKDISDKYLYPPYTTQFGIMFLPFEGLYAEVAGSGLIEVLQRDYHVNVAGPSTMAAMLNSLRMGFQTLAIQKRSGEVWEILGAVKTEFGKFEDALVKTQDKIKRAEEDLDKLVGVRTRQINKKLSRVEKLELADTKRILDE